MTDEITPKDDHSDEPIDNSPDVNAADSDIDEDIAPSAEEVKPAERKLDNAEMQKTVNREINARKAIEKELSDAKDALAKAYQKPAEEKSLEDKVADLSSRLSQAEFYKTHPDLEQYSNVLGDNPAEMIENPAIKALIDKAKAHDESKGEKNYLKSNSRQPAPPNKEEAFNAARKSGKDADWAKVVEQRLGGE